MLHRSEPHIMRFSGPFCNESTLHKFKITKSEQEYTPKVVLSQTATSINWCSCLTYQNTRFLTRITWGDFRIMYLCKLVLTHVPGSVRSARITNTVNITNLCDFFESSIYSTKKCCHSKTVNINSTSTPLLPFTGNVINFLLQLNFTLEFNYMTCAYMSVQTHSCSLWHAFPIFLSIFFNKFYLLIDLREEVRGRNG